MAILRMPVRAGGVPRTAVGGTTTGGGVDAGAGFGVGRSLILMRRIGRPAMMCVAQKQCPRAPSQVWICSWAAAGSPHVP